MNRMNLKLSLILYCLCYISNMSYANLIPPVAGISSPYLRYIKVGDSISFSGSLSYDPDDNPNPPPYLGIDHYYWKYSSEDDWHDDGRDTSHTYNEAGTYLVTLKVKDDDNPPKESPAYDTCLVYVCEVDILVDWDIYWDEGPLYAPVGGEQDLFAFSYPWYGLYFVFFPSGYPEWSIKSKPSGSSPQLSTWDSGCCEGGSEQDSATLSNLTVPGTYTVHAQCGEHDDGDDITIEVVGVYKVVDFTGFVVGSEGPLYPTDCIEAYQVSVINLIAIPYPGLSLPSEGVQWSVVGPAGSNATVDNMGEWVGVGIGAQVSKFDKYGDYTITAKYGETDMGDSIIVKFNLVNETSYFQYTAEYGELAYECPDLGYDDWCDGEDGFEIDDCYNKLEFSCCQSDGTGGHGGCALRVFYNENLLDSCIFGGDPTPENLVYRTMATIEGTDIQVYKKIKHCNEAKAKGPDSGACDGYYCSKFYYYDVTTGETPTIIWRRNQNNVVTEPDDEDDEDCDGH